ncbi:hypothetical protein C6P44_000982 [Monosporozyma unispora]|nr:hypothetical protein C6P44_000982 [Kazachstania unispora]
MYQFWSLCKKRSTKPTINNFNNCQLKLNTIFGSIPIENKNSFNLFLNFTDILVLRHKVYEPSDIEEKIMRSFSNSLFNSTFEFVVGEKENLNPTSENSKENFGVLKERNLNEKYPATQINPLDTKDFSDNFQNPNISISEVLKSFKEEFSEKFLSQENELNEVIHRFKILQEILTKSNGAYKKKSTYMRTTFDTQVKELKGIFEKSLQENSTKIKELESVIVEKDLKIKQLTEENTSKEKFKEQMRKIKLFGTAIGGVLVDYLKVTKKEEGSFEDLFKKCFPDFDSFSNTTLVKSFQTNQHEILKRIEAVKIQPQNNDTNIDYDSLNRSLEKYHDSLMDGLKHLDSSINEVKIVRSQSSNSPNEGRIEQNIANKFLEQVQTNNDLTASFIKLQDNLASVEQQLEIEIEMNHKLRENSKLHDITMNNLMTKYKLLKGNTNTKLTWKQMCDINQDTKKEAIGFDRIENLSHVALQNIVKQVCVFLDIPIDQITSQIAQIAIVIKYERNTLEFFLNKLLSQWKGRELLFETYREAAIDQFKKTKSLNNINHPLFNEMNDLVDALLYKL